MGGVGEPTEGEVLSPHRGRPPSPERRSRLLAEAFRSDRDRSRGRPRGRVMPFASLRSFLSAWLRRARMERDMDAELLFHLEARTEDLVSRGLDRRAARTQARRELGEPVRWKEQGREARGLRVVDQLGADVRYGVRWLCRAPAFTVAAILSIALGI